MLPWYILINVHFGALFTLIFDQYLKCGNTFTSLLDSIIRLFPQTNFFFSFFVPWTTSETVNTRINFGHDLKQYNHSKVPFNFF